MTISALTKIYHKVYFILPIFILSGCIGYTPTYYNDNIEFTVHIVDSSSSDNQNDIHVYIDDKETEFKKIKTFNKKYY